ncbi:zinc finger CCCH-type antiviral protein 1-like [Haliotis cracherodii]|uniref:zinc finger CCCH-type antiviral protein 1-like n=1 Tax=Haliotis cracherodii TaxID=6455 RepID=UPI0039E7AE44
MDTEGDLEINVLKILSAQKKCELSLLSLMGLLRKMKIKECEDPTQLRQKLESFARVITVIEGESLSSTTARIEPSMSVCKDHAMKKGTCPKGENCEDLHICKYFLLSDSCTIHQCIYCHSLNSPHNQKVLRLHRLDQLTLEDMRNIFRSPWNRCVVTTPELCHKFKRNTCKDLTKKCFRIHLCPDYISGSCTSGADCDGHNVSEKSVTDILEKYGIDTQRSEEEVLGDLRELDLSPTPLSRSRSEPVLDQPDDPTGRGISRGRGRGRGDQKSGAWRGRGARGGRGSRGARGGFGGVRGRGENRNREEQPQIHNRPHPLLETYCPPPSQHPHPHTHPDINSQTTQAMMGQDPYRLPPPPSRPYQQYQPYPYHQQANTQGAAPAYQQWPYHPNPGAQGVMPPHQSHFGPAFPQDGSHGPTPLYNHPPGQQIHRQPDPLYQQGQVPQYQQGQVPQYQQEPGREEPMPQTTQQRKTPKQEQKPPPEKESDEICMQKFRKCPKGDKCKNHHQPMIYQWQYKDINLKGQKKQLWNDFDVATNTELEKTYSDPGEDCCPVAFRKGDLVRVNFEDMTGASTQTKMSVRRLSTQSSNSPGLRTAQYKWATLWRWYFEDDSGSWIEYGTTGAGGHTTEATSDSIESVFQQDTNGSLDLGTTGFRYKLMFGNMMQTNTSTSKQRRVRRRPKFVTKEELWKRPNFDPRRKKQICPRGWSIGQTNEEQLFKHYTKVKVSETTDEFQKIANLFHETLPPNRTIVSLERIENGELWIDFDGQREKMERRAKKPVAERQLFHGTTEETIEAISREGFDFRFSGSRVGAIHGAGSYFAREAKYSDAYAKEAGSVKRMFVALVLVGEYTQGNKDHRRPPAKSADNPHELFDSCVDDVNDPKIFVLFKLDQVYPQYIITYM